MKEKYSDNTSQKEVTLYYALMAGALLLGGIGSLLDRSENNLAQAKLDLIANPTTAPERCDPYGCTLVERKVCDGNNTIFDFSDDVCEDILVWTTNYSR